MPIGKKQLLRLIRLVAQLKENRYPNCSSFASDMRKADLEENLNVACTPKTIFRDIMTLKNDFGAPIAFDKTRNGYYLKKHNWDFSCPQTYIEYKDSKGNISERDFEPHTLVVLDGVWYSKGFCQIRNEMRTFALNRITSVRITDRFFKPDKKIIESANEEGIFDPEMVENVVVQCDEYLTNIIQTHPLHPEQKVIPNTTGCELRIKKMSKYRLITWIMHQCSRATVISPKNCAEEIKEFADKLLINHQN